MITVGMNYHVIEGKQQDFEDKFAAVIDSLRDNVVAEIPRHAASMRVVTRPPCIAWFCQLPCLYRHRS